MFLRFIIRYKYSQGLSWPSEHLLVKLFQGITLSSHLPRSGFSIRYFVWHSWAYMVSMYAPWTNCVCWLVLRAGKVVSNTKAYQSLLDVPPPPRNLTTIIKTMLRPHKSSPSTHQSNSPPAQQRLDYGTYGTSKSIGCSHHHRCGTAPLCRSPCLHSWRIGRVAIYTAIVCRRIWTYSAMDFIPHSVKTSSDFG